MSTPFQTAPIEAIELTSAASGAPEWLHLLPPPGKPFRAIDGRGPWQYDDAQALIDASLAAPGPKLFIDINHATTKLGPQGGEAPAYGHISELQARPDGIWARVEWNAKGAEIMSGRAYTGVSPVMMTAKGTGRVLRIWHASLTNTPALGGAITTLSQEDPDMNLSAIAKALGLGEGASEEDILAAISKMKEGAKADKAVDLSALAAALGAEDGAEVAELTVLARGFVKKAEEASDVQALTEQISEMKFETFIKEQIAAGVGIADQDREDLSVIYRDDPDRAARMCKRLPNLGRARIPSSPPSREEITELTSAQREAADLIGVSHDDMLAQLQAEQKEAV
ncbi:phage protease [Tropicibacter alexandrii]|uniref:phage protease n=1 Tax=Tropicibacter alexandrii TaxID=2267683 RepID=UPI001008FDD6|nr:phage protease [Tropicibacter alexandrii]